MNKLSFRFLGALGLCAVIATGAARANAQDKSKTGVWDIHRQRTNNPVPQQQQSGVLDRGRIHDRRPVVLGTAPSKRPPGWDHGRKTGWGDCNVPPGQAKKVGCGPVFTHRSRRRWEGRRRWEQRREVERHEARRHAERRHERVEEAHHRPVLRREHDRH